MPLVFVISYIYKILVIAVKPKPTRKIINLSGTSSNGGKQSISFTHRTSPKIIVH